MHFTKIWLLCLSLCASSIYSTDSTQLVKDSLWQYFTLMPEDFSCAEDYMRYKYEQSVKIAGNPVNDVQCVDDLIRYFYFIGKAKAYNDCIKLE